MQFTHFAVAVKSSRRLMQNSAFVATLLPMSRVIFVGYHGKYWTLRQHFQRRNFSHLPVFHQYGWHAVRGTRAVSPGRVVFRMYPKRRPGHPGLLP
jgi:hypothetical protein